MAEKRTRTVLVNEPVSPFTCTWDIFTESFLHLKMEDLMTIRRWLVSVQLRYRLAHKDPPYTITMQLDALDMVLSRI